MFLRVIVGLLVLVGLGGLGLAVMASMKPPPPPPAVAYVPPPVVIPPHHILVASRAVRAGTMLMIEDLSPKDVPAGQEPAGSFPDTISDRDRLRGAMVRRTLNPDDVIMSGDVLRPGDRGFLAAVLGVGMRAVTVGVDPISGIAGLIWPGDRVDLVLTQTSEEKDQPLDRRVFSETVLKDVRVIAVDQQMVQGGQATSGGAGGASVNRTVTLEASSFDAERVTTAARLGKLSLVVRASAGDLNAGDDSHAVVSAVSATDAAKPGAVRMPGVTSPGVMPVKNAADAGHDPASPARPPSADVPIAWGGDVSPALREHPNAKAGTLMRVYSGQKAEEHKF